MAVEDGATQGRLFPDDVAGLPVERRSPRQRLSSPPVASPSPTLQLDLFADVTLLRTALERALAEAEFAEAARLRRVIESEHGATAVPADLGFLEALSACQWESAEPDELLAAWRAAAPRIATGDRRRQVADALFLRLARSHSPAQAVGEGFAFLPEVVGALWRHDHVEVARSLVRDALLAGHDLDARSVDDGAVRRVLEESMAPEWLAVLGVLRRVWPLPRGGEEHVASVGRALREPPPDGESERALEFWTCLRVAELRRVLPERSVQAARQRMMALNPDLHGLYMRQLT
jgi:hypothetical protein